MVDPNTSDVLAVAYTVEQCWHDAPGGTAVAALRIAHELTTNPSLVSSVDLRLVAGKHARPPDPAFRPRRPVAMLPLGRPLLYEAWTRLNWPKVEAVAGRVDVAHATGLIPCGTSVPMVVTVHDIAFVHTPERFTRHGAKLMARSLEVTRRRADRVICSSRATFDDLVEHGFDADRLRLVPLGVDAAHATTEEVELARSTHDLPERFVLFVGTLEPRKNLARLVEAMELLARSGSGLPLIVAGADGWGDVREEVASGADASDVDVRFLGFVSDAVLRGLYAEADVFAYPSLQEGFGLPVVEAMAQGTPVVTSRGTSTEEVAGNAAVLIDPVDASDIARGISEAIDRSAELAVAGRERVGDMTWERAARATLDVYRELIT